MNLSSKSECYKCSGHIALR